MVVGDLAHLTMKLAFLWNKKGKFLSQRLLKEASELLKVKRFNVKISKKQDDGFKK